jgi:hypothetical protein
MKKLANLTIAEFLYSNPKGPIDHRNLNPDLKAVGLGGVGEVDEASHVAGGVHVASVVFREKRGGRTDQVSHRSVVRARAQPPARGFVIEIGKIKLEVKAGKPFVLREVGYRSFKEFLKIPTEKITYRLVFIETHHSGVATERVGLL